MMVQLTMFPLPNCMWTIETLLGVLIIPDQAMSPTLWTCQAPCLQPSGQKKKPVHYITEAEYARGRIDSMHFLLMLPMLNRVNSI